jgi:TonB-linked SusC/RagA family outer membrane protein
MKLYRKKGFAGWIFPGVLFFACPVLAQINVKGRVTSASDNTPLPGVNILVRGTTTGTTTDAQGQYQLAVPAGSSVLVFSFIGYSTQEVALGGRTVLDVSLAEDLTALEEIVVVGYGAQRKSDLSGSVASIRGEDLTRVPAMNPMQALQGKVAGVQVTSESGAPGAGVVVRIRGVGTFNNASPIYVVDGVILDDINFLSAGDIQSMEVLKDASATAIYGNRGANGVIIITTRQGTANRESVEFSASAEVSVQTLQRKIDLLNGTEFATLVNEIRPGSFNNVDRVPNTDWQDLIFRNAPMHNHQFSATGSSKRMQYYVGVGYFRQEGIIPKSNFERLTIKLNNTYHLSKSVRIGNNVTIAPFNQQNTAGNAVFVVYRAQPTIPPFNPDGTYSEVPGVGNVLADIEYTNSFGRGLRAVGSFFTDVTLAKNLTARSSFAFDVNNSRGRSFTPVFFVSPQQQNPVSRLNKNYNFAYTWIWENTLSYRATLKDVHLVDAVAGYTMQNSTSEFVGLEGNNLLRSGEDFWYINRDNINPNNVSNGVMADLNFSMISYLGRVNYTYDNRFLATVTFRRDGSSKFGPENRWGNFPSFAAGWNIINESFMANVQKLSNLKVRGSWGVIGNDKIPYNRRFSLVDNGINGVFGQPDRQVIGQTYGALGNPNLRWETTTQLDVGVEVGLFDEKLTAEVDYFRRVTDDILIDLAVPNYIAANLVTFNAAQVLNRGLEMTVTYRNEWKGLRYSISGNATTIHNEVLKVRGTGGADDAIFATFFGAAITRTTPGLPIGSFFGFQTDGLFQNQQELNNYPRRADAEVGFLRYVDVNNDGLIDNRDRTNIGSPLPTLLYGLNMDLAYRRFDLNINFQGQAGNYIYNAKETVRIDQYNYEQRYADRWRGEGTSTTEPRASLSNYNFLPSDRFVQPGDFFRLRNITLGYTLSAAWMERVKVRSARLYLRGTNVFTLMRFTGYAPEVTSQSPVFNGVDTGSYPITSIYSAGMNVTF